MAKIQNLHSTPAATLDSLNRKPLEARHVQASLPLPMIQQAHRIITGREPLTMTALLGACVARSLAQVESNAEAMAALLAEADNLEAPESSKVWLPVDATVARRFREIEDAAGLAPGAVLASALEIGECWWDPESGEGELLGWVERVLTGEARAVEVEGGIRALHRKWVAEDQAAAREGQKGGK